MFWRLHRGDLPPFNRANAWSTPWGDSPDEAGWVPQRGYSATDTAEELVRYFTTHGAGIGDDDPIVFFEGAVIGYGPDNEPLVLPTERVVIWLRGRDLDAGVLEHEDDPAELAAVLSRVGRRRRIR